METINYEEPANDALHKQIDAIAEQLYLSVKEDFDYTIISKSDDEIIQKLCLLINFVLNTARRSLKDVKEKNIKLAELDRLKSDFLANVSHELRTPLTLLLGPLELILKDRTLVVSPHHLDGLHRIHRNAARVYFLLNDLLDFSKIDAGCFTVQNEWLDINQYLLELIDDTQGLAQENNIALHYSGQDGIGNIFIDRKIIEKIILNLLSNALKFTTENGRIDIQLQEKDDMIELTVTDTGIGIAEEHLKHIYERFYQINLSGNKTTSGTGIGLALVKQFTELLQGTISVSSNLGQGTTFKVSFPKNNQAQSPPLQEKPSSIPEAPYSQASLWLLTRTMPKTTAPVFHIGQLATSNKKPLILIVEDSADMRAFMQVLLEDRFDIILADNGKQALDMINIHEPQVILTDAMMPFMDGYQLTKAVKSNPKTKHIPVILVTAKTENESIISGLDVGANDYLAKPFLPEELIARIQASLRTYYDYVALTHANAQLEQEIEERKKLEFKNNELNQQLILTARQAGMADIATSVLHNIGNVLNSANISATLINYCAFNSKLADLDQINQLLEEHKDHLGDFLTKHEQGKHLIHYLQLLAQAWKEDHETLTSEANLLKNNMDHIKNIVMQQQALGRTIGFNEKTSIPELLEHSISLNNINTKAIEIIREYEPLKEVVIDKIKLMQIVVNLIKNSMDSLQESTIKEKKITLRTHEKNDSFFIIDISDNGIGIAPEHIAKIFSYGFTTKKTGHGFGLHASAVSAQEMNGTLTMSSQSSGTGATFTLILPYTPKKGA